MKHLTTPLFFLIALLLSGTLTAQTTLPASRTTWDTTPTDWTDSGTDAYTSSFACTGNNMARLNSTGEFIQVHFADMPDELSYTLKGASFSASTFKVQESTDGTTWSDVATYTSMSGSCTDYTHSLISTSRYVRFYYENKSGGNVGLDDVSISKLCLPISRTVWNAGTPDDWTDNGTGSYTSGFACTGDNMGRLDNSGDFYQIAFCNEPDELSYTLKGASFTGSTFKVQESIDGATWNDLASYTTMSGSCTDFTHSLASTSRYVRFYYENKSGGNVGLDDVLITKAGAVSGTPPIVATSAATSVTGTSAVLNGTVDDNGENTSIIFRYGTSPGVYTTSLTADQSPLSAGDGSTAITYSLTGLSVALTYYFVIEATNSSGTTTGSELSFTTTGGGNAPTVSTDAATGISTGTATLNATVNDNGENTSIVFNYGTSPGTYTTTVTADQSPLSVNAGSTAITYSLSGLSPATDYYYVVEATNGTGTSTGTEQSFTTAANSSFCIDENFDTAPTVPTDWTFSGVGSYTSTGSSGVSPNSIRFDNSGDFIETPTISSPTELSFWIKGNSADPSSAFLVEGWDGIAWNTIENIQSISSSETTMTYNTGISSYTKFRFTYTKVSGNVAFDDVQVTCLSCAPPTTAASGLAFSNITANSMQLDFSAGDGDGRMVVMRESSAVSSTPNSGASYTGNTIFGNGNDIGTAEYVVYRGTGTSVTVTGLNPGRTYHAVVYEYANTGDCYQLTAPPTGSQTTTCAEPTTQPLLSGVSVSSSTLTINWSLGDGSHSILIFSDSNSFTDPSDGAASSGNTVYAGSGEQIVYGGTGSSVTVSGLSNSTTYYYQIYSYNDCANVPDYLIPSPASGSASTGASNIPIGYYDDASGKTGADLKFTLKNIIDNHQRYSYTPGVWNAFYTTDIRMNDAGTDVIIWDMYSDNPDGAEPFEMTLGLDQTGQSTGTAEAQGNTYDREHTFPKSWWNGSTDTMYTDIHHLVPSNAVVNQQFKSNIPFGEVTTPTKTSLNGTLRGPNTFGSYTGNVLEPIDEYKGDLARITLYMSTRYHARIASWETITTEGDAIMDGTSYPSFEPWYMEMLLAWHHADPVSSKEYNRNDAVYDLQDNRNPFIDHPEYADLVWGPSLYANFDDGPSGSCSAPAAPEQTNGALHEADIQCTDATGWTHYWNSTSGNLLLSIKLNGNYIGHIGDGVFRVEVGGDAGVRDLSTASYVINPQGFATMGRMWNVNPTYQPTSAVQVRFYYEDADYNALKNDAITTISTHTDMVMYKIGGSYTTSDLNPNSGHGGISSGDYTELSWAYGTFGSRHYAEFSTNSFSGGGIGGGGGGGGAMDDNNLPVSWLDFSVKLALDEVRLTWQTATEQNSDYFEVERSMDGQAFIAIGTVQAQGNSTTIQEYEFWDEEPSSGVSYYRIRQVDLDGSFTYSKTVSLDGRDLVPVLSINPSLTDRDINIALRGCFEVETQIMIYDALGRVVIREQADLKTNAHRISVAHLRPGHYFVLVVNNKQQVKGRFVKL